jgi:hypothetical protein
VLKSLLDNTLTVLLLTSFVTEEPPPDPPPESSGLRTMSDRALPAFPSCQCMESMLTD